MAHPDFGMHPVEVRRDITGRGIHVEVVGDVLANRLSFKMQHFATAERIAEQIAEIRASIL